MAAGISILCYKSKMLANGAHPLMIRVCKDGRKELCLCAASSVSDLFLNMQVQEPCCFRGALHIRRTECGTVWGGRCFGVPARFIQISAGFHGMLTERPPRKNGAARCIRPGGSITLGLGEIDCFR